MRPDKRAEEGTNYTGERDHFDRPILRISTNCPCEQDDCPFDGSREYPVEPDMTCDHCGNTLQPNPVQYILDDELITAHNLACPFCAIGGGCLD